MIDFKKVLILIKFIVGLALWAIFLLIFLVLLYVFLFFVYTFLGLLVFILLFLFSVLKDIYNLLFSKTYFQDTTFSSSIINSSFTHANRFLDYCKLYFKTSYLYFSRFTSFYNSIEDKESFHGLVVSFIIITYLVFVCGIFSSRDSFSIIIFFIINFLLFFFILILTFLPSVINFFIKFYVFLHNRSDFFYFISFTVFIIFVYFISIYFLGLNSCKDDLVFIVAILSICIIMLSSVFFFLVFIYLLGYFLDLVSYVFNFFYKLYVSFFNKFISFYKSFIKFYKPWAFVKDCISRFHRFNCRRVCDIYNLLVSFSVFLYRYLIGYAFFKVLLLVFELFVSVFKFFLTVYLIFYTLFIFPFLFLFEFFCSRFIKLLKSIRGSGFYIKYFGPIEGVVYRFWLFCLKDRIFFLKDCFKCLCFLGDNVSLSFVIINIISIFFVLISLFCGLYVYLMSIGLHMSVCFVYIFTHNFSDSYFILFLVSFSFFMVYAFSIIFFFSSLVFIIILLIRLYYCFDNLLSRAVFVFLIFKGVFLHFNQFLLDSTKDFDLNSLRKECECLEEALKYDDLFSKKISDIQEGVLDKKEFSENPDKFYYKKLFVNTVAILSCVFAFGLMFVCYGFF